MFKNLLAMAFSVALTLPAVAETTRGVTDSEIVIGTYSDCPA